MLYRDCGLGWGMQCRKEVETSYSSKLIRDRFEFLSFSHNQELGCYCTHLIVESKPGSLHVLTFAFLFSPVSFRRTLGTGSCPPSGLLPESRTPTSTLAVAPLTRPAGRRTALWQRWPAFSWSSESCLASLGMKSTRYGKTGWHYPFSSSFLTLWFSTAPPAPVVSLMLNELWNCKWGKENSNHSSYLLKYQKVMVETVVVLPWDSFLFRKKPGQPSPHTRPFTLRMVFLLDSTLSARQENSTWAVKLCITSCF